MVYYNPVIQFNSVMVQKINSSEGVDGALNAKATLLTMSSHGLIKNRK